MRFEGLDLNLLVAFDALMETRSVTEASRRINLSQSATSAAVGRLRAYFGDELFTMMGKRLVPTALALSLEEPTRDVLSLIRANLLSRPEFDPAHSDRQFRMVVSDYASVVLMNEVLRRAYREAPGVTFDLIPFDDRLDDPLRRGEVDFLIFPDRNLNDDHPRQHLFSDVFCCVAWEDNAAIGKQMTRAKYLAAGHVTARFGPARRIAFEERALREAGCERRIEVVAQNFAMMASLVIGTDRIATLHRRLAVRFAEDLPLRLYPLPVEIPRFRESLQWPAPLDRDPAIVWLRGIIGDVAAGLTDEGAAHGQRPLTERETGV